MSVIQGDIIGLIDNYGNRVVKYTYNGWGKLESITGELSESVGKKNPYRYRGYRYDTETGLYYLNSRYYNPEWCRMLNADTVGIVTTSLDDLTDKNLFAYCDNNPIVRRDSSGYVWETVFDIASLAVSVGEVIAKPADPWAWAGLAGDTIDLLPFVTGVGEVTRAVKVANNIDNITDTAKAVKKVDYYVTPLGDAIPATRKGFYNNLSKLENKNGKYYGKDLRGPVRIRVEKHDPKPGYKVPYNQYHTSLHFHIDRKVNGKTGQYKKGFTGLMRWLR